MIINLAILNFFIDDRNSFSFEKWKSLHQTKSHAISIEKSVILQTNKAVKTDLLYMTLITTPEAYQLETRNTSNTRTRALISEELPLQNLMANEREEFVSRSLLLNSERKEKMNTKIINETTLRIYFPKKANTEPVTQDLYVHQLQLLHLNL